MKRNELSKELNSKKKMMRVKFWEVGRGSETREEDREGGSSQ